MELKEIQSLIKFVSESGVDEVDIERKDFKLSIKKVPPVVQEAPQVVHATVPAAPQAPVATPPPAAPQPATPATETKEAEATAAPAGNTVEVKSPMIGTFYRSSSPENPPFVNVGDSIKAGDTICIVEAMKLFNEIEAEVSGKIVKVLVENAQPVEYDTPLFLVEPA